MFPSYKTEILPRMQFGPECICGWGLYNIVWSFWQISQDWSWLYIHRVDVEAGLILYVIKYQKILYVIKSQNWSGFWWCWFNFHITNAPHGDLKLTAKRGFWWCWFNFHIANGPHGDHGKRYTTCPTAYPKGTRSVFQNQVVSNKCFLTTPSVPERP